MLVNFIFFLGERNGNVYLIENLNINEFFVRPNPGTPSWKRRMETAYPPDLYTVVFGCWDTE